LHIKWQLKPRLLLVVKCEGFGIAPASFPSQSSLELASGAGEEPTIIATIG